MKKNIIVIIFSLITIILLFMNQIEIRINVLNTSLLYLTRILPTLLPLFIISKILINYNFPYYISRLFKNNIYIYIFLLSLISGSPNNAVIIKDLLDSKQITTAAANKYIKCSFFVNPLFLYTMLSCIFNNQITITIIVSHYLANIIIYLIRPVKKSISIKINSKNMLNTLVDSFNHANIVFLNMYITIIFFNIIIILFPQILSNFYGLIELTQGLNYLKIVNINIDYKIILALMYISFGGLSIQMQVAYVLQNSKIQFNNFLISRFYQIIISILIFLTTSIIFRII